MHKCKHEERKRVNVHNIYNDYVQFFSSYPIMVIQKCIVSGNIT